MNETEIDELITVLQGIRARKPWQVATPIYPDIWADAKMSDPKEALNQGFHIRLKPWTLGREVNGHRLPEGGEWFRPEKFKEADLPEGYRPLMRGEDTLAGDEVFKNGFGPWVESGPRPWEERLHSCYTAPVRTKRPIVQPILTPPERYRIKPEPITITVPLTSTDILPSLMGRRALRAARQQCR